MSSAVRASRLSEPARSQLHRLVELPSLLVLCHNASTLAFQSHELLVTILKIQAHEEMKNMVQTPKKGRQAAKAAHEDKPNGRHLQARGCSCRA